MTKQPLMDKNLSMLQTNDKLIRSAFKKHLAQQHRHERKARIIEELGMTYGVARVDIALVNGIIHGYELKSDRDTLARLPEQMKVYNTILDRITLVVGKNHLYEAFNLIPEWWGVIVARGTSSSDVIGFYQIREADENPMQDATSVASLLWRDEALSLLEKFGFAKGVRSKRRSVIYERLAEVLDVEDLKTEVRERLCTRSNWRFETMCMPDGG